MSLSCSCKPTTIERGPLIHDDSHHPASVCAGSATGIDIQRKLMTTTYPYGFCLALHIRHDCISVQIYLHVSLFLIFIHFLFLPSFQWSWGSFAVFHSSVRLAIILSRAGHFLSSPHRRRQHAVAVLFSLHGSLVGCRRVTRSVDKRPRYRRFTSQCRLQRFVEEHVQPHVVGASR